MQKPLLKIVTLILILSAIGLGIWLINKNFFQQLVIKSIPEKNQPMLSTLGPQDRVRIENDYQLILDSPVYFDLRTLPWFSRLRISLIYRPAGRELEGVGWQVGPGFQYQIKEPILSRSLADGWQEAIFDLDLTKVYQQKNVKRFLISTLAAEGQERGELKIQSLELTVER